MLHELTRATTSDYWRATYDSEIECVVVSARCCANRPSKPRLVALHQSKTLDEFNRDASGHQLGEWPVNWKRVLISVGNIHGSLMALTGGDSRPFKSSASINEFFIGDAKTYAA